MLKIIENTLRDGSYVIDFQFDAGHTTQISAGLFDLGFQYIEVGHGLGLGAWNNPGAGLAKENDQAYITAAKSGAPQAMIGAFFIPGIGSLEDINAAVDCGLGFLRIGTNIDTYARAHSFAAHAKKAGLIVTINLMKSYGVKPYEFTQIVREVDRWQTCDAVYLVDSAGCMMPEEVTEYIDRTRERVSCHLGFHGHNNLSMAVANTLAAVRAGATFIDSSIRGMGRSAGNAQTEILVHFLQEMGISPIQAEMYKLYDFANRHIVPLMAHPQGLSDEEIHVGISRFHTSFQPTAERVAKAYSIDFKRLIKGVSDINCINPAEKLFEDVAARLRGS